jgi:hypothetical protein
MRDEKHMQQRESEREEALKCVGTFKETQLLVSIVRCEKLSGAPKYQIRCIFELSGARYRHGSS